VSTSYQHDKASEEAPVIDSHLPNIITLEPSHWPVREYLEVTVLIGAVTLAAWLGPLDYRAFGDIYLLSVIVLCLRVGRWPIVYAAILSAFAWNYFIVPPRMSFSVLDLKDGVFLGTYCAVALIAGQLTARIRSQQRNEHEREQRAMALLHLSQALSAAMSFDDGVNAALRQADSIFSAKTTLLLPNARGELHPHPASSLILDDESRLLIQNEWNARPEDKKEERGALKRKAMNLVIRRASTKLGVFSIGWTEPVRITIEQRRLIEAFSAQLSLWVEREQLRTASERQTLLEESDRLHRTLLDSVSHELKTPIAVLSSAAEGLSGEKGKRREVLVHEIRTATQRLSHLVANLLNQTRLESGAVKARLDWCDARDLVVAARKAVGDSLSGRPFSISIPEDMPLFMADAVLMEQVIGNLLLNVVHHTPPGSEISVCANVDAKQVSLAVCDRGPGVAPELKDFLFQKFQRGSQARPGGLGLGLSIVKGLMLAQGGDVVADDNPGGGARFTLYLPHAVHETVPVE
jgi:two-component system sensor histidine kinase KdpD